MPAVAATFSDSGAFAAATTGLVTESFDNDIAGPGIFDTDAVTTFDGGITSTASTTQQFNKVEDGAFVGGTRAGRTDAFDRTLTFSFGRSVTAFGGFFTDADPIIVSGMFDGVASSFLLGDVVGSDGFAGLTSTTGFSEITFSTDTGGFLPFGNPTVSLQAINFGLDDFSIGDAAPAVPLPAPALLLVGGLAGFGALRKMRGRA